MAPHVMRPAVIAALAMAGVLASALEAAAHGTGARTLAGGAFTVELYYSDGEPMAFAEARVYGPGDTDMPFQNGRADRLGRVAFHPDRDGAWRIEGVDGEGHRITTSLTVSGGAAPASAAPSPPSRWPLWSSLTLNLFAAASWLSARRRASLAS